jgi:hypothetical protein
MPLAKLILCGTLRYTGNVSGHLSPFVRVLWHGNWHYEVCSSKKKVTGLDRCTITIHTVFIKNKKQFSLNISTFHLINIREIFFDKYFSEDKLLIKSVKIVFFL